MSTIQWKPMCFHSQGINDYMKDILLGTTENQQLFEGSQLLFEATQLLIDSVLQACTKLGNTQGLATYFSSTEGMLFLLLLDKVALKQIHADEDISENSRIFFRITTSLLRTAEVIWNNAAKMECVPEDAELAAELCTNIHICDYCRLWGVHLPHAFDDIIKIPESTNSIDAFRSSSPECERRIKLSLTDDDNNESSASTKISLNDDCEDDSAANVLKDDDDDDLVKTSEDEHEDSIVDTKGMFQGETFALCVGMRLLSIVAQVYNKMRSQEMFTTHFDALETVIRILNTNSEDNASNIRKSFLRSAVCVAGVFIAKTSGFIDGVCVLVSRNTIISLASLIGDSSKLPVPVRAEVARVISGMLWRSSRVSAALVRRFREGGCYDTFLECVNTAGTASGTTRAKALWALCTLLFVVPSPSDADTAAMAAALVPSQRLRREAEEVACMQNYDGIVVLLKGFIQARSECFKTDLLRTVQSVYMLQICKTVEPAWKSRANLFITLFEQFDALSLVNKRRVLDMVDGAAVSFNALAQKELSCYCALLVQNKNHPSTILLIAEHLSKMLTKGTVPRPALVSAGLFKTLITYIRAPRDLECLECLADPGEAAAVSQLLHLEPTGDAERKYAVACGITQRLLELLGLLCSDCVQAMTMLVDSMEFAELYKLITIPEARTAALDVIAVAASVFCRSEHCVVATMIAILKPDGRDTGPFAEDTSAVIMRTAILDALLKVLTTVRTQDAAIAFREGGGFAQVFSLIDSFRPLLPSSSPLSPQIQDGKITNGSQTLDARECTRFHVQLMRVVSAALKGHPENVFYIRHKVGLQRVAKAIVACAEWCCLPSAPGSDQLEELLDVLFGMSIRGPWPMGSAFCKSCEAVVLSKARGSLCPRCADLVAIEVPEVLVTVVTLLLDAVAAGGREAAIPHILGNVMLLASASLSNVEALSKAHMQAHICAHYGWPALIEKAAQGEKSAANALLSSLLYKLCTHDIPDSNSCSGYGNFVHELFSMGHQPNATTLSTAHALLPAPGECAPINYAVFTRGTCLIGASQKWRAQPVAWPPTRFTTVFWGRIHRSNSADVKKQEPQLYGHQLLQHHHHGQLHDAQQIFILRADTFPPSAPSFLGSSTSAIQLVVRDDGALILRISPLVTDMSSSFPRGDPELIFPKTRPFEDGRWHHIVITYAPDRGKRSDLQIRSRNGSSGSSHYYAERGASSGALPEGIASEWTRCALYVDGVLTEVCSFVLPPSATSMMMPGTAASVNAAVSAVGISANAEAEQLSLTVGSEISTKNASIVGKTTGGRLEISNTFLFADSISSTEALVMHALGPTYDGYFRDLDIRSLRHSVVPHTTATGPQHYVLSGEERAVLTSPGSISLQHLAPRMLAAFITRNLSFIVDATTEIPAIGIPFVPPESAVKSVKPLSMTPRMALPSSVTSLLMGTMTMSQSLEVPRAREGKDEEAEKEKKREAEGMAMWELKLCTCRARSIRSAINDVGGVQMLLYMLGTERTSEEQHSTFRLLTALLEWSAANSADFERADGYNVLSRIMRCAEWHIDEETVTDVLALVGLHDGGERGAIADLEALRTLALDWEVWTRSSMHVREHLVTALGVAVTRNPNADFNTRQLLSLKPIAELLVVLWRPDTTRTMIAPLANLIRSLLRNSGGITRREIRYLAGLTAAKAPVGDTTDFATKQEFAVKIITEIIASGDVTPAVQAIFMEEVSLEINMNLLLDAPSCNTRLLLISLLGTRLSSSTARADFEKIGGFTLLAHLLSRYPCDVPTLVALFKVLIGVNKVGGSGNGSITGDGEIGAYGSGLTSVHIAVTEMMNTGVTKLAHPDALVAIMQLAAESETPQELRVSVVKAFQRICAASESAVKSLLDCGLLLAAHNLHLAVLTNDTDDGLELSPADDDVFMGLYRDVVLASSGKSLDTILMFYSSDGLADVQLRIVQSILGFFKDNLQFCYNTDLASKYAQVVDITTRFVVTVASPTLSRVGVQACEQILATLIGVNMSVLGLINIDQKARRALSDTYAAQISESEWRAVHHVIKVSAATRAHFYTTELLEMALEIATSSPVLLHTPPDTPFVFSCMMWILALCTSHLASGSEYALLDEEERVEVVEKARMTYSALHTHASHKQKAAAPEGAALDPNLDVCEKLLKFFGAVLPLEYARSVPQTFVDEAILCDENERREALAAWEGLQSRLAAALQSATAMDKLATEQLNQRFVALHVGSVEAQMRQQQQSPESSFVFAQTKRLMAEGQAAHEAWKKLFKTYSHERGVFAITLHAPFKRIAMDPTQDSQHQRLRTRWAVSDPTELTLEKPYIIPKVIRGETGTSLTVKPLSGHYSFRIVEQESEAAAAKAQDAAQDSGKSEESNGSNSNNDNNGTTQDTVSYNSLPIVSGVNPPFESDSLKGGGVVTITGRNFHPDDKENLAVYIGAVRAPILNVASPTELTVTAPPAPRWGFYEVVVTYKGCLFKPTPAPRYGYIEMEKFKRYLCTKNKILPNVGDTYALPEIRAGMNGSGKRKSDAAGMDGKTASDREADLQREKDDAVEALRKSHLLSDPVVVQAKFTEKCTWVTMYSERQGFIILTDDEICFYDTDYAKKSWRYADISEIHGRRHVLRDVAIELFFVTGKACLIAFADKARRDLFWSKVLAANLPNVHACDTDDDLRGGLLTNSLTDHWVNGSISNYEYLMRLNTLAGRTFNDLNQYPVFPWVIADYTSETLDLNNPKTFRDLSKPMGAQSESGVERYAKMYSQLAEMGEAPYNYGSHYSNAAIAIYYLTRLEPYASFHVLFQSGRFDVPDRLFHSITKTFGIAYGNPIGDVKELVPEFFCLPEFLDNISGFDFGERQDGSRVFNIDLPPWAHGDPREFVRLNRAALESEYVSAHLHEWIDLIFGCKQQSKDAVNVFHPYTCEGGIDWDAITDPAERIAKQTQVNTWGQTPRKLFRKPHPQRNMKVIHSLFVEPVLGCRGCHVSASAVLALHAPVADLLFLEGNRPIAFPQFRVVTSTNKLMEFVEWGSWDNSLYAFPALMEMPASSYSRASVASAGAASAGGGGARSATVVTAAAGVQQRVLSKALRVVDTGDALETTVASPSGNCLVSGTRSGALLVWKRPTPSSSIFTARMEKLFGHTKAITAICVSNEYNIIVSASDDCTCIIWDISRLKYVATLKHDSSVSAVCISSVNGNIVTVERRPPHGKPLRVHLWSVNGQHLAQVDTQNPVSCVQMTSYPISIMPNSVVVGCTDGSLEIYEERTLALVMAIRTQEAGDPITFIKVSQDNRHVFTGDSAGTVVDWAFGEGSIELDL